MTTMRSSPSEANRRTSGLDFSHLHCNDWIMSIQLKCQKPKHGCDEQTTDTLLRRQKVEERLHFRNLSPHPLSQLHRIPIERQPPPPERDCSAEASPPIPVSAAAPSLPAPCLLLCAAASPRRPVDASAEAATPQAAPFPARWRRRPSRHDWQTRRAGEAE